MRLLGSRFPILFLIAALLMPATGALAAPDPAVARFDRAVKAKAKEIRKLTNSQIKARAKDRVLKAASRKYTLKYNRVYGKVVSKWRYAHSRLSQGLRSHSQTVVKNRIKTFTQHIDYFERLKRLIDKDLARIKYDKKRWWKKNKKYFDGRKLSPAKLKSIAYWVRYYGTPPFTSVMIDPKTGKSSSYTGAVEKEASYLRALKARLTAVVSAYKQALGRLQAHLRKLSGKAAPADMPVGGDM